MIYFYVIFKDTNDASTPAHEECHDIVAEPMQESSQHGDSPLPPLQASLKRTSSHDHDDEGGIELLSPEKRPRLDDKSREGNKTGGHPDAITKVADSPMPVKDEPMAVQEDNKAESNEPIKPNDLKLEKERTEKELDLVKLSQTLNDKESQSNTKNTELLSDDQAQLSETRDDNLKQEDDPKLHIVFSDEEDEGGAIGSHVIGGGRMLSSQMNRQIDRVQVFLKLERLRRPKK
jgi:hypothetical protein